MNFFTVILIIGFAVATQALTDEQKQKVAAYNKECTDSSGVNSELVTKGRKGEFTDDAKLKEFIFCFFKKTGFQNEAGEIQPNVIKAKISGDLGAEEVDKVLQKCGDIKKDTPQETAFDVYKCYWENTSKHISLA